MQLPNTHGVSFLPPGARLGKYEIIRGVAVGGMAELYLARAAAMEEFDRLVALKRILPQYAGDEEFVRMFLDEARLTAKLHHPSIAQVYDIGMDTSGLFFTMEFIHGENVQTLLRTADRKGKPIPLAHAIAIARSLAAGLNAAHEQRGPDGRTLGIVHRDVSPSNVVVSFDGDVKLIDFGVAKAKGRHTKTKSGTIKGKVSYMSPEQCRGEPLDHRSDVFSLGILLYEITTTSKLFIADNEFALIRQIAYEDVRPPSERFPDYPPALEAIVMRAMSRDIDLRYQSTRELETDLEKFARDHSLDISSAALCAYMRENFPDSLRSLEAMLVDKPQVKEPGARPRGKRPTLRNPVRKRDAEQSTVRLPNRPGAVLSLVPGVPELATAVPEEISPSVTEPLQFEELEEVVAADGPAAESPAADVPAAESLESAPADHGEPEDEAEPYSDVDPAAGQATGRVRGRRLRARHAAAGLVAVAAAGLLAWAAISGGRPSTQASVQRPLADSPQVSAEADKAPAEAERAQARTEAGDANLQKPARRARQRAENSSRNEAKTPARTAVELTAGSPAEVEDESRLGRTDRKRRQRRSRSAGKDDRSTRLLEIETATSGSEQKRQDDSWDPDSPLPPL